MVTNPVTGLRARRLEFPITFTLLPDALTGGMTLLGNALRVHARLLLACTREGATLREN